MTPKRLKPLPAGPGLKWQQPKDWYLALPHSTLCRKQHLAGGRSVNKVQQWWAMQEHWRWSAIIACCTPT